MVGRFLHRIDRDFPLIGDLDGNGYRDVTMGSWSPFVCPLITMERSCLDGALIGMCTSVGKPAMGDIDEW
jgi:hypothetical protein